MSKIIKVRTLDGNSLYVDIETIDAIPIVNSSNNQFGIPYGTVSTNGNNYPIDAVTAHFIMAMKMDTTPVSNVIDASVVSYDPEANQFTIGEPPEETIDDDYPHQMSIDDYVPDGDDVNAPYIDESDDADDIVETPEHDQD